jgi:hypothetical protein
MGWSGFFAYGSGFFWVWIFSAYWFISVPPVRGGTYFSLPPQRKVGKRKRLKPPTPEKQSG